MYYYDSYGWLTSQPIEGRSTDVAPPAETDTLKANWTGTHWVLVEYVAPPAPVPPTPPVDPYEFLLDIAPFTDRLEPYKFQIDTHTDPFIQYFNRDLNRRKYVDLKDPRVAVALNYMAGHTIAGIGTIATPIFADAFVAKVLTTPTTHAENNVLRSTKVFG